MVCASCLQDIAQYGPLGYCESCGLWYKEEGEKVDGVYEFCSTKDNDPELCDSFVRSLLMRVEEVPEGEEIPIAPTTLDNIRQADRICASCEAKNFLV